MDELFRSARLQLAGSAYAARPIPFESIIMSMLIMQQRMIAELEQRVGVIEQFTASGPEKERRQTDTRDRLAL